MHSSWKRTGRWLIISGVCVEGLLPGWVDLPRADPLPHVNRMTDACENITFPILRIRSVKKRNICGVVRPSISRRLGQVMVFSFICFNSPTFDQWLVDINYFL